MGINRDIQTAVGNSSVLIVDDDDMLREFIEALLAGSGFTNISQAGDGQEALDQIAKHRPDCMILDISMPVMDGWEVLARLRADPHTQDIPVLVITAHDDREERIKIMRSGAANLISKPVDPDLLVERTRNIVERKLMMDRLTEFHTRMSAELDMAAKMQTDAMPKLAKLKAAEERYDIRIANVYKPSSELGGDYWTLQPIDDHRFGVLMADFSGHGVGAALNTFRLTVVLNRLGACKGSPGAYLEAINDELCGVIPLGQFCTIIYALVDLEADTVTYAAAASPPPLYGRSDVYGTDDECEVSMEDGSGLPLGIRAGTRYKDRTFAFPKNSFLFLFSDALFETELDNGHALEIEGVVRLTKAHGGPMAGSSLASVLSEFLEHAPSPLPDDLTAVWISR